MRRMKMRTMKSSTLPTMELMKTLREQEMMVWLKLMVL